jgi:hypothetical protein
MSINIGFKSDQYSLNSISTNDNKLLINTYNDSNAIMINCGSDTLNQAFINFQDNYSIGLKSDKFIIYDNIEANNIADYTSSGVIIYNNIGIKDVFYTTSNLSVFTSNVSFNLKNSLDKIQVYNDKKQIILQTSSNSTQINNVKIDDTLYVNKIQNFTGSSIDIYNPNLVGLILESFNTEQSITVNNLLTKYYTGATLLINRYDNLANIVEIGTCNIYTPKINKQFLIDRKGQVGIGTKAPEAPLSISRVIPNNPYIFKYIGNSDAELVNIMTNGSIGIGTTLTNGSLDIFRDDRIPSKMVVKDPLIKLNVVYDENSNIMYTSNVKNIMNKNNDSFMAKSIVEVTSTSITTTSNYTNEFYLINNSIHSNFNMISLDKSSNIKFASTNNTFNNNNLIFKNTNYLYYPKSMYGYEKTSEYNYKVIDSSTYESLDIYNNLNELVTSNTCNFIKSHTYKYSIILMSGDTYEYSGYVTDPTNPKYNANKFFNTHIYHSNIQALFYTIDDFFLNTSSNFINNVYYDINAYIEDTVYPLDYDYIIPATKSEPSHFFYMSSNNSFKASLSSYGTLALGSPDVSNINYFPNKYVLYADGNCFINKAELNQVTTSNIHIDFNYSSVSNMNILYANSNNISNALIHYANINNLINSNQICSNMYASNLTIQNVSGNFIKMNSSNIHLMTQLSVSSSINDIEYNNNYLSKFVSNKNLTFGNTYFKNYKALYVTNETNTAGTTLYNRINPSISIIGYDGSIPYLHLSRDTDYFMRINNKTFSYGTSENTDIFEICCDTLTGSTNRINYYNSITSQPSFINHYKRYNVLSLGETNSICIKCTNGLGDQSTFSSVSSTTFTNATGKISVGFPYGIVEKLSFTVNDWPQYFNNNINNFNVDNKHAPYMLNVFGNTGIYSIYGKQLMTVRADDGTSRNEGNEKVTVNVGSVGDVGNTMVVYGEISANKITQTSDSNVKTDLKIIENALEKVKTLTGYTFLNTQTSNIDTGLIAQEVQKVLPEAVQKNNDNLLTISYGNMMGILVESIKDLTKKIQTLDHRIENIEHLYSLR